MIRFLRLFRRPSRRDLIVRAHEHLSSLAEIVRTMHERVAVLEAAAAAPAPAAAPPPSPPEVSTVTPAVAQLCGDAMRALDLLTALIAPAGINADTWARATHQPPDTLQ